LPVWSVVPSVLPGLAALLCNSTTHIATMISTWLRSAIFILSLVSLLPSSFAQSVGHDADGNLYVSSTNSHGDKIWLADSRKPALYTSDFGECMIDSQFTISRFDAGFYKDNMTLAFHLEGVTSLDEEHVTRMWIPLT
jgi:hypothetical protein